jgi:hypothetical protein
LIKRRESELAEPGAIERANRKGVTIRKMIEPYLDEYEKNRPLLQSMPKVEREIFLYNAKSV